MKKPSLKANLPTKSNINPTTTLKLLPHVHPGSLGQPGAGVVVEPQEVEASEVADEPKLRAMAKTLAPSLHVSRLREGARPRRTRAMAQNSRSKKTTACLVGAIVIALLDTGPDNVRLDAVSNPATALEPTVDEWITNYQGDEDERGEALAELITFFIRVGRVARVTTAITDA
jgi:hypothetical protein